MSRYKIIDCEQGSEAWHKARLGKITASVMSKIVTKTGKRSSSMDELVNRAVAELVMGEPDETFVSDSMMRGKDLEDQALEFFNFVHGFDFVKCGFLSAIDQDCEEIGYGASPDGINPSMTMGLELKCPEAHTHLAYLASGTLPDQYIQQVQASLMVTGFEKWIFGSYHPNLPCLKVEVARDEKFISEMRPLVLEACEMVKAKYKLVKNMVEAASA